jgi:hypothetical protein
MTDLITLDEYKEFEGISSSNDDSRLEKLIPSVSQLVKTYCGNSIIDYYSTNRVELFSVKWGSSIVQLTESPLISIVSVEERDRPTDAYTALTENTDYYLDFDTDSVIRISGKTEKRWKDGPGSVKVTYKAGYSDTPEDLKLAVIDLVKYYIRDEHKERRSLAGATIENQGVTKLRSGDFPDHIQRVLDLYKTF